jgi:ectoine hydroxylase-related dioxygenase (phytanoyl-CoA dioxygenase family)
MDIPRLSRNAEVKDVAEAIERAGCVIIEKLFPEEIMDRFNGELERYFEQVPMCTGSFMGFRTQRTARVIAKAPASVPLFIDPLVLGTVKHVLRNECYHPTLHHTEAVRIHPGQTPQNLHRDDTVYPFKHPCRPLQLTCLWAVSDFTLENGASRAVPGSHLWDDVRKPQDDEIAYAVMPKGSVFLFNASLYHGGGGNTTKDQQRTAAIILYGLGWLRAGENPYLAVPPPLAKTLPEELQMLLGYHNHGYLGHYELQSPMVLLGDEPVPEVLPATDLYGPELEAIQVNRR